MRCQDLMTTNVECAWARESVLTAAARMRFRGVGFLPVCDDDGHVLGSVSDRDLTVRVLADERSPRRTPVDAVMTHAVVCCRPSDPLDVVELRMKKQRASRVVCVDAEHRPVGIITLADIALAEWTLRAGDVLRAVAERCPRNP
jgi:CBS domain-containing protein